MHYLGHHFAFFRKLLTIAVVWLTVNFNIKMYGRNNACKLIIQDTVPPAGEAVLQKIFACEDIPDVTECLTDIEDITDVTAVWKDIPDYSQGGSFIIQALLTDGCGNETVIDVPFEVTRDSTPPVITCVKNIDAYIGDPVSYRENVIVTDDYDGNPVLEIDTSAVDLNKAGTYDVVYTAKDFSGNESSVTVSITLSEKPAGYVEPEVVYAAAKEILDEITTPDMTEEEIALQIVWWCRYKINFVLKTDLIPGPKRHTAHIHTGMETVTQRLMRQRHCLMLRDSKI